MPLLCDSGFTSSSQWCWPSSAPSRLGCRHRPSMVRSCSKTSRRSRPTTWRGACPGRQVRRQGPCLHPAALQGSRHSAHRRLLRAAVCVSRPGRFRRPLRRQHRRRGARHTRAGPVPRGDRALRSPGRAQRPDLQRCRRQRVGRGGSPRGGRAHQRQQARSLGGVRGARRGGAGTERGQGVPRQSAGRRARGS